MLKFFIILVILDTITGIAQAIINQDLSSRVMKNGMIKNAVLITVLSVLNAFLPESYEYLRDVFITGFIITNFVSLFENLSLMGIEIPGRVEKVLSNAKDKNTKEKEVETDETKEV